MTSDLQESLSKLKALSPVREETVPIFLAVLDETVSYGNPEATPALLALFDDHCTISGVMSTLSARLEELPLEGFVHELLAALPEFFARSPYWCEHEVRKLLWSAQSVGALGHAVPRSDQATCTALEAILHGIESVTPQLTLACATVRAQLNPCTST